MIALFSILIVLLTYWTVKNLYYDTLEMEYKFKAFALRDKIRREAALGNINPKSIAFQYLDLSTSKFVRNISSYNLYVGIWLMLKHKRENEGNKISQIRKYVDNEINKNDSCKIIHQEYGKLLFEFIRKKHYLLNFCVISLFKIVISISSFKKGVSRMKSFSLSNVSNEIMYMPETSEIPSQFRFA